MISKYKSIYFIINSVTIISGNVRLTTTFQPSGNNHEKKEAQNTDVKLRFHCNCILREHFKFSYTLATRSQPLRAPILDAQNAYTGRETRRVRREMLFTR